MIDNMDKLYEIVGRELKKGEERPGLMARAIAETEGDPNKAKSVYIKYRVAELIEEARQESLNKKGKELESFLAEYREFPEIIGMMKKIPDLASLSHDEKQKNLSTIQTPEFLYKHAYDFHYNLKNTEEAAKRYRRIIDKFPESQEAGWSREQLNNIPASQEIGLKDQLRPLINQAKTIEGCTKVLDLLGFTLKEGGPGKWIVITSSIGNPYFYTFEDLSRWTVEKANEVIAGSSPRPVVDKSSIKEAAPHHIRDSTNPAVLNNASTEHSSVPTTGALAKSEISLQSSITRGQFKKDPSIITTALKTFLWILFGLCIISVFSNILQLNLIQSRDVNLVSLEMNDQRQRVIGIVQLLVYITTGILFLVWIHRANRNARALGAKDLGFTPGWSIGYYFIPILNLFRPYQAMKEIWKASRNPNAWKDQPGSPLLGWWWTLWLISNVLGQQSWKMSLRAKTLSEFESATVVSIVSDVIDIPLMIVAICLVGKVIIMQKEWLSKTTDPAW